MDSMGAIRPLFSHLRNGHQDPHQAMQRRQGVSRKQYRIYAMRSWSVPNVDELGAVGSLLRHVRDGHEK